MAGTILAFGGKGGSGKTTLAAMVLRQLVRLGHKPVLAVDADPNATLAWTLGLNVNGTIADLRDRMGNAALEVSEIPKDRLMGHWLAELLSEDTGFDVLTMGRPEGPKCYCYVNALLRRFLRELRDSYAAVIVDCEAGMEYLSRLTVDDVDTLVLVAEATPIGLTSVKRIAELADALPIRIGRRVLALNKVGQPASVQTLSLEAGGLDVDATVRVPFDADLYRRCLRGDPIDAAAGEAARPAIEGLARLCQRWSGEGLPQANLKEPRA
jgi:CO dehydrogenase maturation factor